jgi:YbgC/YbaW family acyl-CoA thioester hydrolase
MRVEVPAKNPHSLPMTPTIEYAYQVMFFDTDCAAVVHNLAYLRIIETARTMLADQIGLDMATLAKSGTYPVLLRTEVDYRKPAKLMDKLLVRGRLESVERVRFWCAFEIVSAEDNTLFVTCRQSLALIQMPPGKPLRLPDEWAQKYAHLRT